MKKRFFAAALAVLMLAALLIGCASPTPTLTPPPDTTPANGEPTPETSPGATEEPTPAEILGRIRLSTTTSTEDSGLLEFILPAFTAETGWEVDVIAVGTGAALQMGRDGDADVLLVHARPAEDQFVEDGYAVRRYDVMYNDFIIVGPGDGPIEHNNDIEATLRAIYDGELQFVSRGDDSGTHMKELSIWEALGLNPEGNDWYISAGDGMGATLDMAREMNTFTLTDRATWLGRTDRGGLVIVCEGHPELFNPYGVIPVSASVHEAINTEGGQAFADWLTSPRGQELIGQFGVEEFGEALFTPDA